MIDLLVNTPLLAMSILITSLFAPSVTSMEETERALGISDKVQESEDKRKSDDPVKESDEWLVDPWTTAHLEGTAPGRLYATSEEKSMTRAESSDSDSHDEALYNRYAGLPSIDETKGPHWHKREPARFKPRFSSQLKEFLDRKDGIPQGISYNGTTQGTSMVEVTFWGKKQFTSYDLSFVPCDDEFEVVDSWGCTPFRTYRAHPGFTFSFNCCPDTRYLKSIVQLNVARTPSDGGLLEPQSSRDDALYAAVACLLRTTTTYDCPCFAEKKKGEAATGLALLWSESEDQPLRVALIQVVPKPDYFLSSAEHAKLEGPGNLICLSAWPDGWLTLFYLLQQHNVIEAGVSEVGGPPFLRLCPPLLLREEE